MDRTRTKARLPLLAFVLLALLAVAVAAPISGEAKKKAAKCKGKQVPVKVNGKTSCKPLAAALPKPKPIDPRLAYMRAVLNLDVSKLDGGRGKRARSLKRGFGAAGKKARKAFLRGVPKLLAMIDGLAQGPQRSARARADAVASRARCGPGQGAAGDTGNANGLSIEANVSDSGAEGGTMQYTANGQTFRMTFTKCGSNYYYAPSCPSANGDADSSARGQYFVTMQVLEGDRLVSSQSTSTEYRDKLHGKVAADALLDYLDFERTDETLIVATGGVVHRSTETRKARVNMRGGGYDPRNSSVSIQGDASSAQARRISNEAFAANVEEAIKEYRAAERGGSFLHDDGWSSFDRKRDPYCAKAVFSPESQARKLLKGQSSRVEIYAKAQDGGRAVDARWEVLEPSNASFSPTSATGPSPTINLVVSANPVGNKVRMTAKFTSTAGVGKDTWTQDIDDVPLWLGHVDGTASEDVADPEPGCDVHYDYDYESNLSASSNPSVPAAPFRIHPQIPGGEDFSTAFGNGVSGSGTFAREACGDDIPACTTSLEPDGIGDVQFHVQGGTVEVNVWTSAWKNDSAACDGPLNFSEEKIGEASFPLSMLDQQTVVVPVSFDFDDGDITIAGSGTLTLNRAN